LSWAVREFGYTPVDAHNPDSLRKLCSGSLHPLWKYVVKHVKSEAKVATVKGNLKLSRAAAQDDPSKSSLSLSKFEEDTLSERDILLKDLKDINFLTKKCREKSAKVKLETAQNTKAYAALQSSIEAQEAKLDSQLKRVNFLDSISEQYTNKASGKLQQLAATELALKTYLAGQNSSGGLDVKAKFPAFDKMYSQSCTAIKAATSVPKQPLGTPPVTAQLVSTCVKECDNNPKIMVDLVTQKVRDLSQKARGVGQNNPVEAVATNQVLQEWRSAHVSAARRASDLEKQAQEQERLARIASEKAKRLLQEIEGSVEKKAAILKLVCVNEKRARLSAAFVDLKANLIEDQVPLGSADITAKLTRIESLKSSMMNKQRTINILNERNSGFQQKITTVQDCIRSMAKKEALPLANRVGEEAATLSPSLVANRVNGFKLSVYHTTLCMPDAPRPRLDTASTNAAILLRSLVEDKADALNLAEFRSKADVLEGSQHVSALRLLLDHAKTDLYAEVVAKLNFALAQISK